MLKEPIKIDVLREEICMNVESEILATVTSSTFNKQIKVIFMGDPIKLSEPSSDNVIPCI